MGCISHDCKLDLVTIQGNLTGECYHYIQNISVLICDTDCEVCCSHNTLIIPSFMTYHPIFTKSNTTGAASGTRIAYLFRVLWLHRRILVELVLLKFSFEQWFIDHCLSLFFWSLYCISFFDLRILVTTLVSSNLSYLDCIYLSFAVYSLLLVTHVSRDLVTMTVGIKF